MEDTLIWVIVVVVIGVGIMFGYKSKKNTLTADTKRYLDKVDNPIISLNSELLEVGIRMELLPSETIIKDAELIEIVDRKVLAKIDNLIPGLMQVGNATHNAVQAVQTNGELLYKAIIPAGAKLADSKGLEGAVRGFYHEAGNIKHANFVAAEVKNGTTVVANTAAAAMSVASMVVGQYYMNQINAELCEINDELQNISSFQNNEYRSKVFSLMAHVKVIADFQIEILENNELRLSKISQLDGLEKQCTELLGQANLTIVDYTKKKISKFDQYEKAVNEIDKWHTYQNLLMSALCKISDLRYTLHFGAVSRDQCSAVIHIYMEQADKTQKELCNWHNSMIEHLKIDTDEIRRKRTGVGGVILSLPGKFLDDLNYKDISVDTAAMVEMQMEGMDLLYETDPSNLYLEDVQIISKDGKLYYLPTEQ